jgi:Lar family restriction alleviation protein
MFDEIEEFEEMPQVYKCPFCRREEAYIEKNNDNMFYVDCTYCGAKGPYSDDRIDAVKEWNRAWRK